MRSANAIIEQDLVVHIRLSPAELGLVTAAYLGAFAVFQLPLSILLDKYGLTRVSTALLSVAAVGTLLFSMSQSAEALTAGRATIGLGFARDTAYGDCHLDLCLAERLCWPDRHHFSGCIIDFHPCTRAQKQCNSSEFFRSIP